jgi:hypothetical protein
MSVEAARQAIFRRQLPHSKSFFGHIILLQSYNIAAKQARLQETRNYFFCP